MGRFHIAFNFLAIIDKKFLNSGLEDLLIESGVYAAGTTSALIKGKSYNRGVRAHKLCMEAFFRLMWPEFVRWYNTSYREQSRHLNDEELQARIASGVVAVVKHENTPQIFPKLEEDLDGLICAYDAFKSEARGKFSKFSFWEEYCSMVNIVLQLIKAERTGNWNLHLSAVATMTPHFYAMNRPNYSRWLPVYLIDMHRLEFTHPLVHKAFLSGEHSISHSGQPFSQVPTDMALEQSINADSKTKGGIIGISQSPSAVDRWFLTIHEHASVTTAIKKVYGMKDNDNKMHKEATKARVKRDEDDVNKLLSCFTSSLMIKPYSLESDALVNFVTGVVLPDDVAETLVNSTKKGQNQMNNFIEERINPNTTSFWDSIPNNKVKTFSSVSKKVSVKATDEKLMTVNADRDIFGRLLIMANARQINLKEV